MLCGALPDWAARCDGLSVGVLRESVSDSEGSSPRSMGAMAADRSCSASFCPWKGRAGAG